MAKETPVCVECALEGRPLPADPTMPRPEEANPPVVSVDIAEQSPKTTDIHHQYGVLLCGEHVGSLAEITANNGTLVSIHVRARLR